MTWNPLRKNYLSQKPTSAQPLLTQAEDRELDLAFQRLVHVQDTVRRLIKETKRYANAISILNQADQKLSGNLSSSGLAHTSDEFRQIVEDYHSITTQIGKNVPNSATLLHKTLVEPLKKFFEKFALIAAAIGKREELASIWRCSYNRVKKLQEKKDKSASHVAKLEREKRAEEEAGKELRSVHSKLLIDLPWFLDKRLEYIKPSVHALIMIQLDYYGNATRLFTQLMPIQKSPSMSLVTTNNDEENFQALVNGQMNRIKSLTIVKDRQ